MAYIVVTTDGGEVVSRMHHGQFPVEAGQQLLLNWLAAAVLKAESWVLEGGDGDAGADRLEESPCSPDA